MKLLNLLLLTCLLYSCELSDTLEYSPTDIEVSIIQKKSYLCDNLKSHLVIAYIHSYSSVHERVKVLKNDSLFILKENFIKNECSFSLGEVLPGDSFEFYIVNTDLKYNMFSYNN
jgi:hypothetical protein